MTYTVETLEPAHRLEQNVSPDKSRGHAALRPITMIAQNHLLNLGMGMGKAKISSVWARYYLQCRLVMVIRIK
ncbi:hypothetical protein [Nitrosomonas eutropha]|uniref:hypothetical protein n=1 Tax=Nitrosomonas eutropha TaxID=916 RepID=UPI00210CA6A3|nr:hypothetical protein [Nitrosomonas eutropha]